jgi:hypothetical protein
MSAGYILGLLTGMKFFQPNGDTHSPGRLLGEEFSVGRAPLIRLGKRAHDKKTQ